MMPSPLCKYMHGKKQCQTASHTTAGGNVASLFLNGSNASAHEIADGDAILILRTN